MELIKGNWYEGETSGERWLFKFDKLEDDKYYTLKTGTPIDNYKNRVVGHFSKIKNIKPANMEEVYKFFPEEKQEEFKLPEKWYIALKSQIEFDKFLEWCVLNKYLPDNHLKSRAYTNPYYCSFNSENKDAGYNNILTKRFTNYTEITFEQFKQYVLKENNMDKEIIGYKLIKPEYKSAAQHITAHSCYWRDSKKCGYDLSILENISIPLLEKAGVLDLWFEPVYKSTEKTLTLSNGKSVVLSKEKGIVVEGTSVSPRYLSNIKELYISSINDWKVELKDATYKIGCWDNVKLSDINLILETYKNMQ